MLSPNEFKSEPSWEKLKFKGMILDNSEENHLEQNGFLYHARLSAQDVGGGKEAVLVRIKLVQIQIYLY